MYLLLDTNVVAGYYLPRSLSSAKARANIEVLLDSVRSGGSDHFLYIPNICVAETKAAFMKYAFGAENTHVRNNTLDKRVYTSLLNQFGEDIHNGRFFYQYELTRHHILGIELVTPIDHYYKIRRNGKSKKQHRPAATFDHLIVSMGIQLAHIHGRENVAILTSDGRLADLVKKCRGEIKRTTQAKLKLERAEELTGRAFSPEIFPQCVNLARAGRKQLDEVLGEWPLPIKKPWRAKRPYRWKA